MMPLPNRPLSATLLRCGGETILFDCGENTQVNWRVSDFSFRATSTILLSHLHADHVAGLPGVLFQLAHAGRTEPVTIYGPAPAAEIVERLLSIVGRLPYDLRVVHLDDGASLPIVAGLTLGVLRLEHRLPCLGFRLDLPRAPRFDPDRARALGVPIEDWSRLQRGEPAGRFTPEQVLGPPRRGLRVTLVTDTALTPTIAPFARGSDLFVCEAMYASDEDAARARERGHLTARQAAGIAAEAGVTRLWLTHFSPAVEDLTDIERAARAVFPEAIAGTPGLTARLTFDDDRD